MPNPLLATKLSLPILRHIPVPRTKVLRQLSEGVQSGHLLTLVSAPAGYGKTTAIRMWVEEAGHPIRASGGGSPLSSEVDGGVIQGN